jgi:hypothetical protein
MTKKPYPMSVLEQMDSSASPNSEHRGGVRFRKFDMRKAWLNIALLDGKRFLLLNFLNFSLGIVSGRQNQQPKESTFLPWKAS